MSKAFISALIFLSFATDGVLAQDTLKRDPLDLYIDSVAQAYTQQPHTHSLAIGIVHHNRTKAFFYGETAKENAILPTEETIYEIGSMTQIFTATLLADVVEKGIIRLEDPIVKFLPDSIAHNTSLQGITFQSLANHTSGLPHSPSNLDKNPNYNPQDPYALYTRRDLFAFLKSFQANTTPGEKYEYSPLGYGLLGELISMIAKKPYGQLVKEVITTPLSMTNTTNKLNPKTQQLIQGYDEKGQKTLSWNTQAMAGATVLKSSLKDLLVYAQAQFNMPNTPLERAMALTRQFTYFLPPDSDIGLAWHMNMVGDIVVYSHTGNSGGYRSFIALAPDKKSALVVLTNTAISTDDICTQIMERIIATE